MTKDCPKFRASPAHPCPVCGSGTKGCSAKADGLHWCRGDAPQNPDDWRLLKNGRVWKTYRGADDPTLQSAGKSKGRRKSTPPTPPSAVPSAPPEPLPDFEAITRAGEQVRDEYATAFRKFADRLGVPVDALKELRVGGREENDKKGRPRWVTTWPEKAADGTVDGITIRFTPPRGGKAAKWMIDGSSRGFYFSTKFFDLAKPAAVVFIVEGGSDTAILIAAGVVVIGRSANKLSGGQDVMLAALLAHLPPDCKIVVVAERDEKEDGTHPGREGAEQTATAVARCTGRAVLIAFPPDGYKDSREYLTKSPEMVAMKDDSGEIDWGERGREYVKYMTAAAEPFVDPDSPPSDVPPSTDAPTPPTNPPAGRAESNPTPPRRPQIIIGTDEGRVNDEARAALAAAEGLYHRGGNLVYVANANAVADPPKHGVARQPDAAVIHLLPKSILREKLSDLAEWSAWKGSGKKAELVDAHPPEWSTSALYDTKQWPSMKRLDALVCHPVVLADGTLVAKGGYYEDAGLFVSVPLNLKIDVPDRPTGEDVRKAVARLMDVVCDFPFESEGHKAAWLAALLTPICRFMYDGNAPWFLADGNIRGVGKGKLFHVISLILFGHRFATTDYTNDPVELKKMITTIACEGDSMVLFDNLDGVVGNAVLDVALTSTRHKGRILGVCKWYDGPMNVVWYGTGNNINVRADSVRRTLPIRIVTDQERPELAGKYKHDPIEQYVKANREKFLADALTIVRGWVVAGRPTHDLPRWGSFEEWSAVLREIVVFAGLADPGSVRPQAGEDPVEAGLAELFRLWPILCNDPTAGVTASEIASRVEAAERQYPPPEWVNDFREAAKNLGVAKDYGNLGHILGHQLHRTFVGKFLDVATKKHRTGVNRWVVKNAGEPRTPKGAGVAKSSPAPCKSPKSNPYRDLDEMADGSAGDAGGVSTDGGK